MKRTRAIAFGLTLMLWLGGAAHAMEDWEVRQLLTRTGFGVAPDEYLRFKPMSYAQAVDTLLAEAQTQPKDPLPDWAKDDPFPNAGALQNLTPEERQLKQREVQRMDQQHSQELKAWWYQEMLDTDSPLTERMTLFWHNHFTSSLQKVHSPQLMAQQNALLRSYALGNFRKMTHAVAKDPAMILYLDNASNRRGAPNENFARELMELFTLGEGHYTETDIKESARSFTGWGVNRRGGGSFLFQTRLHDPGAKTFMGQTGDLDGDEVIDIILAQPQAAVYVAQKVWKEFVSPTPDPAEVERLAKIFRDSDYEIKPLLKAILLSPAFRDRKNAGTLVKSPVDLMVGTLRTFKLDIGDPMTLVRYGRQLGQDVFDPPNVKGWPGGEAWIDSNTLLLRQQILQGITRGPDLDRREMAGTGVRMGAGARGNRGARQGGGVNGNAEFLASLTPQERGLAQRVQQLRGQGIVQPQLNEKLQSEGYAPADLRALNQKRQQFMPAPASQNGQQSPQQNGQPGGRRGVPPGPRGDAMMAQRGGMTMPRADLTAWTQSMGKLSQATLENLLVPLPPVEVAEIGGATPSSIGGATGITQAELQRLLQDPVFELK